MRSRFRALWDELDDLDVFTLTWTLRVGFLISWSAVSSVVWSLHALSWAPLLLLWILFSAVFALAETVDHFARLYRGEKETRADAYAKLLDALREIDHEERRLRASIVALGRHQAATAAAFAELNDRLVVVMEYEEPPQVVVVPPLGPVRVNDAGRPVDIA